MKIEVTDYLMLLRNPPDELDILRGTTLVKSTITALMGGTMYPMRSVRDKWMATVAALSYIWLERA